MNDSLSQKIKEKAYNLGFDLIGFTNQFKPEYRDYFLSWLKSGKQGEMKWLQNNVELRLNPQNVFDSTKSAIVLGFNYAWNPKSEEGSFKIARYVTGEDYHTWMKDKCHDFASYIQEELDPHFRYRAFVDTGPVLERDLALKAGLGWVGKNTCLINANLGSFVFLAVIFCNLNLSDDAKKEQDHCGSCDRCLKACPTKALKPYQIDASKCLAYQNIEKRGERDKVFWKPMGPWLVGCDLCQEVCPWNKKAYKEQPFDDFEKIQWTELLQMDEREYKRKFNKTAISRIHYLDFMRNLFIVIANLNKKELLNDVLAWQKRYDKTKLAELDWCLRELL